MCYNKAIGFINEGYKQGIFYSKFELRNMIIPENQLAFN